MILTTLALMGAAYVAGAFTPAVGRKIKAFFVKESTSLKPALEADVKKVETKL